MVHFEMVKMVNVRISELYLKNTLLPTACSFLVRKQNPARRVMCTGEVSDPQPASPLPCDGTRSCSATQGSPQKRPRMSGRAEHGPVCKYTWGQEPRCHPSPCGCTCNMTRPLQPLNWSRAKWLQLLLARVHVEVAN